MSITITRNFDGPETFNETLKGKKRVKDYSLQWRAICDEGETAFDLRFSPEVADVIGLYHPEDFDAYRTNLDIASETNGPTRTYLITAGYSTDEEKSNKSPIYPETPAIIGYSWERKELALDKDLDDKPIVNTAQDPFDPPLTIENPIRVKTIQVNLSAEDFNVTLAEAYDRCVNSDSYDGYGPGKVLCQDITAQQAYWTDDDDNEVMYWQVVIKLAFDKEGWNPVKKLSAGYNELYEDESETKKRRIRLPSNEFADSPVPLNENGEAVFGDDVETDAHYCEFELYNEASFAVFDLV